LDWRVKLKRKIKLTKESKIKVKIKGMTIKFGKKNQDYRFKVEIKNKLKFNKKNQT